MRREFTLCNTNAILTQFLEQFLVLVELLEGLDVHVGKVGSFGLVSAAGLPGRTQRTWAWAGSSA